MYFVWRIFTSLIFSVEKAILLSRSSPSFAEIFDLLISTQIFVICSSFFCNKIHEKRWINKSNWRQCEHTELYPAAKSKHNAFHFSLFANFYQILNVWIKFCLAEDAFIRYVILYLVVYEIEQSISLMIDAFGSLFSPRLILLIGSRNRANGTTKHLYLLVIIID